MNIWDLVDKKSGTFNTPLLNNYRIILGKGIKVTSFKVMKGMVFPPLQFTTKGASLIVFPRKDRSISRMTLSFGKNRSWFVCDNDLKDKLTVTK
jgi:hypothetical protein